MLLLRLFQHMKPRYYSSPVLTSLSLFNHSSSSLLLFPSRDRQSFITSLLLVSFWPCVRVDFILACRTLFIVVYRTKIGKMSITYLSLSFNLPHAHDTIVLSDWTRDSKHVACFSLDLLGGRAWSGMAYDWRCLT